MPERTKYSILVPAAMHLPKFQRSIVIFLGVTAALVCYPVYITALDLLGYYVVNTDPQGTKYEALAAAIAKKDPEECFKIVVPFYYMGSPEYDLVNGCWLGYIEETNDVEMCARAISAASCVWAIAERTYNPDLCEQAYFTKGNKGDRRGSCFGYFAAKEKDYGYCERLEGLEKMNQQQWRMCNSAYTSATGDYSLCPEQRGVDWCYRNAANFHSDATICYYIKDERIKEGCFKGIQ